MFQSIERKHPHFYQYFRIVIVIAASILYAWNLCCFAKAAKDVYKRQSFMGAPQCGHFI